ncbi:DUF4846 domain-containing protein [Polyangium sp. y55x31]|uniref:DUF4846 domain-containing protein n=1 Tax=Polyangium sp. y55x31 TaxID=3042688 RepID=UPI002482206B|nr:DUF4846 domain-containing protein [Polyangium sp. y55x31]MDI1475457.1 DUF4846 domain-containing protein [Polyangium sp. y55x31]
MRWTLALLGSLSACTALGSTGAEARRDAEETAVRPEPARALSTTSAQGSGPSSPSSASPPAAAAFAQYPWLEGGAAGMPAPVDTLEQRFPPPPGFTRVHLAPDGFGAFLRTLPLAAKGTPVKSYRGDEIRADGHPNVAAVVAIDVGKADLQQCADAIVRLHAEWRWSHGHRDQGYRTASGTKLEFQRYASGQRVRVDGNRIELVQSAKRAEATHALFRTWLDDVFGWTNTGALARDGERVALGALRPGDFFVLTGVPFGHTVLVLDMAKDAAGRRAVLLGQSFVPAQNVHVIRPEPASAWFVIDEAAGALTTPFWDPFPFDSIRRLPE